MYNLLTDTEFKYIDKHWNLINCSYTEDGCLESTSNVFGIEQSLVISSITKLYFRFSYAFVDESYGVCLIGIQNGNVLEADKQSIVPNKYSTISVVANNVSNEIKLRLIFESDRDYNKVLIKHPVLYDLKHNDKATYLKSNLDIDIDYRKGYSYDNLLKCSEIKPSTFNFKSIKADKGKVGCLYSVKEQAISYINIENLTNSNLYLCKIKYKGINKFGKVYLQYGSSKSVSFDDEQEYIVFRYKKGTNLELVLQPTESIEYLVNLKNIILIDLKNIKLDKADIPYLPFIGE